MEEQINEGELEQKEARRSSNYGIVHFDMIGKFVKGLIRVKVNLGNHY